MSAKVLFTSSSFTHYDSKVTLPEKFKRMIDKMDLKDKVSGKSVAIKMHLGRNIGTTTVHPLFIKILIDKLLEYGAKPFVCDQETKGASGRGYTPDFLGAPIVDVCGLLGKYFYPKEVNFKTFKNVDVAGHINDADFMIDLSHVKGHGSCGYGGACKNIAMGCVTDRTRAQIHRLEGGLKWDKETCTKCQMCVRNCNHSANSFKNDIYTVNYHHCTFCQHCVKVCPVKAVTMDDNNYRDFQTGMALCTKEVLDTFEPGHVYYINFLTNITALCDCWGMSTPNIVPDIGIMSSDDIVAVEKACIDAIKVENLIPNGIPTKFTLGEEGHLFERLHGKNPIIQLDELYKLGLGSLEYELTETF